MKAHYRKGQALLRLCKPEAAVIALKLGLQLAPSNKQLQHCYFLAEAISRRRFQHERVVDTDAARVKRGLEAQDRVMSCKPSFCSIKALHKLMVMLRHSEYQTMRGITVLFDCFSANDRWLSALQHILESAVRASESFAQDSRRWSRIHGSGHPLPQRVTMHPTLLTLLKSYLMPKGLLQFF